MPIGSTVAIQYEDGGPWMHRVIEEANKIDHNGRSYTNRVMNTGRLIMQITRHICSTPITTQQYLWEQTKRTGQLEDIFMKTIPVNHSGMLKSYRTDSWTYMGGKNR